MGNIRVALKPEEERHPSFVIGLYNTRVEPGRVEKLFREKFGPELFEVIHMGHVGPLSKDEAERQVQEVRTRLVGLWPHARLCVVVTSYGVSIPGLHLRPPAIADFALACRHHAWVVKILNQKTFDKMLAGGDVAYPNVFKETNQALYELVRTYQKTNALDNSVKALPAPHRD
ncbi:MAG: hypothetical protein KGH79_03925 [Patescibacteria group bacterium]|nr:hypothetical protein [Patescibacteria group bacterium]